MLRKRKTAEGEIKSMAVWDCAIVDDEEMLTEAAAEYFNLLGVSTVGFPGADEFRAFLQNNSARLILLDINLPGDSGFILCRELRETSNVPILFLSARSSDDDKIAAYELGGDDYIQKPCSLSVLLAKVRAVLKRCASSPAASEAEKDEYDDGWLCVNRAAHEVHRGGSLVKLTPMEFRILLSLLERKNCVVSKQELIESAWEGGAASDAALNVHIRHLREQIERDPGHPEYIVTVHGEGYRFVPA